MIYSEAAAIAAEMQKHDTSWVYGVTRNLPLDTTDIVAGPWVIEVRDEKGNILTTFEPGFVN